MPNSGYFKDWYNISYGKVFLAKDYLRKVFAASIDNGNTWKQDSIS